MKKFLYSSYARWVVMSWFIVLFLRITEFIFLKQHQSISHLFENELFGLALDIVLITAFLAVLFPVSFLLSRISFRISNIFMGSILILFSISHLLILQYFVKTLKPLGGILIEHTFQEVLFTIRSSDANYFAFGISVLLVVFCIIATWKISGKINSPIVSKIICVLSGISIVFSVIIVRAFEKTDVEFPPYSIRANKSLYFYRTVFPVLFYSQNQEEFDGSVDCFEQKLLFPSKEFVSTSYPLLSKTDSNDVLGAFLNPTSGLQFPNIVLLVVEGLGSRFMYDFSGLKLMPFLDSIANKSLYWDKALTVGERSFNVIPSSLASTPYGKKNFASENGKILHLSLINILSKHSYYSTFFYGQPKWFHDKGDFLKRNGIDKIVDCEQYPESYHKIIVEDYFWGYHDQDLVRNALKVIKDDLPESPRFDLYFTGSMHQPFIIADKEDIYDKRLTDLIIKSKLGKNEKDYINTYWKFVRSILFTDDALRELFAGYEKQPSYENTIFIITGDHPMTDIPIENAYKRYRVPIIIYSPLLKEAKTFHSVNSHLDIAPTLLTYLHKNYGMQIPNQNAFIGKILDTNTMFRNVQPIVFMNDDRNIVDILYEDYFLFNEKTLFQVDENDNMKRINDSVLQKKMINMLQYFRSLNTYCCSKSKLIPDSIFYQYTQNVMLFESLSKAYKMSANQEFDCQVIPETKIVEKGQYSLDFYVKSSEKFQKETPLLVVESYDLNTNKQISWHAFNLYEEGGRIHLSFNVEEKENRTVKAYFWNNNKVDFNISDVDCHLYRLTK